MIKRIILLILIIFVFKGCTKDDICPEDTATTSNLVIVFKDIANPANLKKVELLSVLTDNIDSVAVVKLVSTDSIVIPLNTNSDTTRYLFKKTVVSGTDTISRNFDKMIFTYQRKNSFVTRACGYKVEFYSLDPKLEEEGTENWIQQVIKNRDTVNDENSAHVTLLH
jgi:hypothetical protein